MNKQASQRAEQEHLTQVYQELMEKLSRLENFLTAGYRSGREELQKIQGEVALNFETISDNLDTFAALEAQNREIDQLNISLQSAEKEVAKIKRLLPTPYFGKLSLRFADDGEDIYIGINGFTNQQQENLIYDWRSPIAELFYTNALGPTAYKVNDLTIDVIIELRRQLIIQKNQLLQFFDTTIAIQDDVLLSSLANDSSEKMQDITASIQQEQNQIIRDLSHPTILVQGVAGSGKTSVVMQRIAYLLYRKRESITADDLLILSPNRQFIDYIAEVLPALGERNPRNLTLLQFVDDLLPQNQSLETETDYFHRIAKSHVANETQNLRSAAFAAFLIKQAADNQSIIPTFTDLHVRHKVIISRAEITAAFNQTPAGPLQKKLQGTKKILLENWQRRLLKNARSPLLQAQLSSLSEEQQLHYFGELIEDETPQSLQRYALRLLQKKYRRIEDQLQKLVWVNIEALLADLYQTFFDIPLQADFTNPLTLDTAVSYLFVRQLFAEKLPLPSISYLLIDEVQDYTFLQLAFLLELFEQTEITMVGDDNQAIFNSQISFSEITALLTKKRSSLQPYQLLNSYRSSGEITKIFSRLTLTATPLQIVAVRPAGEVPTFIKFSNLTEFQELIAKQVSSASEKLTILTKTQKEAQLLTELLKETPQITVLPISYAKGLEFNRVLLYDVSNTNFQSNQDKKILYTAVSRATQQLIVTYQGQLTNFLA
ncbi:HelD family protein [Enterococcus sp. LJL120]